MDAHGNSTPRDRMGMLFQFGALFTDMQACSTMWPLPLRAPICQADSRHRRAHEAACRGPARRAARLMPSRSLGRDGSRRVALARRDYPRTPKLIMYDEPFCGPGPLFRWICLGFSS